MCRCTHRELPIKNQHAQNWNLFSTNFCGLCTWHRHNQKSRPHIWLQNTLASYSTSNHTHTPFPEFPTEHPAIQYTIRLRNEGWLISAYQSFKVRSVLETINVLLFIHRTQMVFFMVKSWNVCNAIVHNKRYAEITMVTLSENNSAHIISTRLHKTNELCIYLLFL